MSDSNRVAIRACKNDTENVTNTNPKFESVCHTGMDVSSAPVTVASEKICGETSRGTADQVLVGTEVGGGWTGELEVGDTDVVFEGLFQNTWNTQPTRTNRHGTSQITGVTTGAYTVSAVSGKVFAQNDLILAVKFTNTDNNKLFKAGASTSGTSIVSTGMTAEASPPVDADIHKVGVEAGSGDIEAVTSGGNALTSSTLDFEDHHLNVGQWIYIGGRATANRFTGTTVNNDYARISAIEANRLSFDIVPSGWTADAGSGKTIRLFFGDFLTDGSTKVDYTLEQAFLDHSPVSYIYTNSQYPDSFSMNAEPQSIATYTMGFIGMSSSNGTTRTSGAQTVGSRGFDSINTSSNVARIAENGTRLTTPNYVTGFSLNISNSSRRQNAVGTVGSIGVGSGRFVVSGNATTYFGDLTVADKVINNTESSIDAVFEDKDGRALFFDIPRVKYSSGSPNVPGQDQDNTLPAEYTGLIHSALGYTASCTRFWCVNDTTLV